MNIGRMEGLNKKMLLVTRTPINPYFRLICPKIKVPWLRLLVRSIYLFTVRGKKIISKLFQ